MVLKAIRNNSSIKPEHLPTNISLEQVEELRLRYQQKIAALGEDRNTSPRNHIFFHLIQDRFPTFSWETRLIENKYHVVFNAPRVKNLEPSLLSLLLGNFPFEKNKALQHRYNELQDLPAALVDELDNLFEKIRVILPDNSAMKGIVDWIKCGLNGAELNMFSLACPDYSVEITGDPSCPFKHTFNELGSEIGLIARRVLEAIPIISQSLKKFGIKVNFTLAMADYEVLSDSNLTRLKLSFAEFEKRMDSSRKMFQHACLTPIQTPMVTELCGGYEGWKKLYLQIRTRFTQSDFGQAMLDQANLFDIIKTRKQLYDRWHGASEKLEDYLSILLDQGAEYSAVGTIISQQYPNCLILGADHSALAPFYSVEKFIPSLYLKRFYC